MKKIFTFLVLILILLLFGASLYFIYNNDREFTAEDFDIETAISTVDYNNNGVDDYRDILIGARIDAENAPTYDSRYFDTGYPPDNIGVCTDVVWRAFKNAGYCLREMVDNDIMLNNEDYPHASAPDKNIDFRRVVNLQVFFEKYAESVTTDLESIEQWQPGDIVIFGDCEHIGIVSDIRSKDGKPYIIHNSGQPDREEDLLHKLNSPVTYHYRFDAAKIDNSVLIAWNE